MKRPVAWVKPYVLKHIASMEPGMDEGKIYGHQTDDGDVGLYLEPVEEFDYAGLLKKFDDLIIEFNRLHDEAVGMQRQLAELMEGKNEKAE